MCIIHCKWRSTAATRHFGEEVGRTPFFYDILDHMGTTICLHLPVLGNIHLWVWTNQATFGSTWQTLSVLSANRCSTTVTVVSGLVGHASPLGLCVLLNFSTIYYYCQTLCDLCLPQNAAPNPQTDF